MSLATIYTVRFIVARPAFFYPVTRTDARRPFGMIPRPSRPQPGTPIRRIELAMGMLFTSDGTIWQTRLAPPPGARDQRDPGRGSPDAPASEADDDQRIFAQSDRASPLPPPPR